MSGGDIFFSIAFVAFAWCFWSAGFYFSLKRQAEREGLRRSTQEIKAEAFAESSLGVLVLVPALVAVIFYPNIVYVAAGVLIGIAILRKKIVRLMMPIFEALLAR